MGMAERLSRADRLCAARGERFTPLRRRVLEVIAGSRAPVGAYAILERLAQSGRVPAPPTVYRALEFLCANGLVHRVATRNAYVACDHPDEGQACQLLLCTACGQTVELHLPRLDRHLRQVASRTGFQPGRLTVEMEGLCPGCRPGHGMLGHA